MEPIRWGIVGCGAICDKAVAPCMAKLDTCELVAGMRRDAAALAKFAETHGLKRSYADYDALLADAEVEAIYVATPPALHLEQTRLAAAAGKHVLCEKPMAMNAREGWAMIEACRDAGVKLGVSYYRRYFPQIEAALEVIGEGQIGEVGLIRSYHAGWGPGPETGGWRFVPELGGGGAMMDVGSHRIDLVILLGGEPERASGFAESKRRGWAVDDTATAIIAFESGAQGIVTVDWTSKVGADIFEIHGSEGRIVMPDLSGDAMEVHTTDGRRLIHVAPLPNEERDIHLLDHFAKWVRGAGEFRSTGEDGVKTTEVMDAVYACSEAR